MRAILLFLDGVGIGRNDPESNPFFRARLPRLRSLLGNELPHSRHKAISTKGAELVPTNATLGVPGLPQSGTGQTAIFTGANAAKIIKRHFGPHPTTALRPIIDEKNIFRQLKSKGKSVCFANAFPQQFFDYIEAGNRRLTVTTLSCQFTGVPLLRTESLIRNQAVSADITRSRWPELGYPELKPVTPHEAGKHLWNISAAHDFTLFEYWLPDHAGHSRNMAEAVEILERFDGLLAGLLEDFDERDSLLVIISDHGNIEDLTTKTHTRNSVPCITYGKGHKEFAGKIRNLTHLAPTLVKLFDD